MNYVYFMLRLRWEWRCCCRGVVGKGVMLGIGAIISRGEGVGGGACVAMELRGGPEGRSTAPGGISVPLAYQRISQAKPVFSLNLSS